MYYITMNHLVINKSVSSVIRAINKSLRSNKSLASTKSSDKKTTRRLKPGFYSLHFLLTFSFKYSLISGFYLIFKKAIAIPITKCCSVLVELQKNPCQKMSMSYLTRIAQHGRQLHVRPLRRRH